jgi:hypothetical protein
MTIKRIQVKETQGYWGDFEGTLESIIVALQAELDAGWEGIIAESYGYDGGVEYYLYKHREETDKEYNKRVKQIEKEKEQKEKAKAQKLEKLKKELSSLSKEEKEQLGL